MPRAVVSLPPGPRGSLVSGNLPEFRKDRLGFLSKCASEYGDVVRLRLGPVRIWALNHPDLVEDVLVTHNKSFIKHFALRTAKPSLGEGLLTSEGDFWRRQRKLSQPAFHRERVAGYAATMVALTDRALEDWRDGQPLDAQQEMMAITLEIVAKTLFDADVRGEAAGAARAMDTLMECFTDRVNRMVRLPIWLPVESNRRFKKALGALEGILYRVIAERRAEGGDRGDLLSMLLQAHDEEDGTGMTDKQLRDELMTLFLAGHETTANTLAWCWYLLDQHPEVLLRLHEELDEVLEGGRLPGFEDLPRLRYADAVITETLRVYPTVWLLGREAIERVELGGYILPRGHTVWLSQWVVQRDERWFEEPERFRPERWLDGLAKRLHRYAYFPFGGGPRVCIGNQFAQVEAVLLLATIARRFRLRLRPGAQVRAIPTMTLRPTGMPMVVEKR